MRHPRLLITLLLLATVLVDLAVLSVAEHVVSYLHFNSYLFGALLTALAFSQVGLATIWGALGKQSAPWRLTGAFLVVVAWSVLLGREWGDSLSVSGFWAIFLMAPSLPIMALLSVLRLRGWRLNSASGTCSSVRGDKRPQPWQFSVRYLFAWMTAVAIILGSLLSLHRPALRGDLTIEFIWPGLVAITVFHAVIAVTYMWAVLGTPRPLPRVSLVTCVVIAVAVGAVVASGPIMRDYVTVVFVCEVALLVGSLYVLRTAGYRVIVGGRQ